MDTAETPDFVFSIPHEKFIYRSSDGWEFNTPVGPKGIKQHLLTLGKTHPSEVPELIKSSRFVSVHGWDMAPNQPPIYELPDGRVFLNTWVPPTVVPAPGEFPTIRRVLSWLTAGDLAGQDWLEHWIANKIQNPELVPKVAILFGTTPGAGKGTLAFVIREMLGQKNTATIQRGQLESRFNSRWIDKLFVLADEVVNGDNLKDISELLKVLIDGGEIEHEGKHDKQRAIRNRLAWMFASNDTIAPISINRGDRRYTVFNNHEPLPQEYVNTLNGLFERNRTTPTDAFRAEIAAFNHHLLSLNVDLPRVLRPYSNDARDQLISANVRSHDAFFTHVEAGGIEELIDAVVLRSPDFNMSGHRAEWDFGAEGLSTQVLYACYREFCSRSGLRPLAINKFGGAVQAHRPVWPSIYRYVGALNRQVRGYVVPRGPTVSRAETLPMPAPPASTPEYPS